MLSISADGFRRRLAGLESVEISEIADQEMRDIGIDFVLALRDVFGDSLNRVTMLWPRILTGISIASRKCGGNVEKFIAEALEHVRAEGIGPVTNQKLERVHKSTKGRSKDWQMSFVRSCRLYKILIVMEAREIANDKFLYKEFDNRRNEGGGNNE